MTEKPGDEMSNYRKPPFRMSDACPKGRLSRRRVFLDGLCTVRVSQINFKVLKGSPRFDFDLLFSSCLVRQLNIMNILSILKSTY